MMNNLGNFMNFHDYTSNFTDIIKYANKKDIIKFLFIYNILNIKYPYKKYILKIYHFIHKIIY